MWSSTLRAGAIAALLLPAVGWAADVSPDRVAHYSVGRSIFHGDAAEVPPFTLLDPDWRLPPIETIDVIALVEHDVELTDRARQAGLPTDRVPAAVDPDAPITYSVSERLTAQLRYRHSDLFGTARSEEVRNDDLAGLANQRERDVVDLGMSWHLAGSTLGVGYQLQSARTADNIANLSRFLPGNQQATHALTLGLTREWGAALPPDVTAPLPLPDAEAPSTPAPSDS